MIQNSTYYSPNAYIEEYFTQKENQVIIQLMQQTTKQTWLSISNILYTRCGRHVNPQSIRNQWAFLTRSKKSKKKYVKQFIYSLISHKWFCFSEAIKSLSEQSLFKNYYYAKQFMKFTFLESLNQIQTYGQVLINNIDGKQSTSFTHEQKQQIIDFLILGIDKINHSIKPQKLRFIFIYFFLKRLKKEQIDKFQIVASYDFLKNYIAQFACNKGISKENYGRVCYEWTAEQLRTIYNFYCQEGMNIRALKKVLTNKFGDRSKFNTNDVRSILGRLIKTGFKKLTQTLSNSHTSYKNQKQYELYLDQKHALKFLVSTTHDLFYLSVKLMGLGFGKTQSQGQLLKIYRLLKRSYDDYQMTKVKKIKLTIDV